jgi:glycosyltransferase involved in cell wall biosynthesis
VPFAVVGHHHWASPGGGQLVCAASAVALEAMGYMPVLASAARIPAEKYVEWFGIDLARYRRVQLPFSLKAFGLYLRDLAWWPMRRAVSLYRPGLLFTDEPTYRPLLGERRRGRLRIIEYIHFPIEASIEAAWRGLGFHVWEDPYLYERYGGFPMNLYWHGYVFLLRRFKRDNPFEAADLVLTNSSWTAEVARRVYGERPRVLNPPLPPLSAGSKRAKGFEERQPSVIMLGRFSEEKRYAWALTEFFPELLKHVPDAKLYILGGAATPVALALYRKLAMLARRMGYRTANDEGVDAQVYLLANVGRDRANRLLDSARAFLHATVNEHWGIAVAEAMARGLPVLVHRSGGAWTDLAGRGEFGLGYGDAKEGALLAARLLMEERAWRHYSEKSSERVKELSLERFVEAFARLVGQG